MTRYVSLLSLALALMGCSVVPDAAPPEAGGDRPLPQATAGELPPAPPSQTQEIAPQPQEPALQPQETTVPPVDSALDTYLVEELTSQQMELADVKYAVEYVDLNQDQQADALVLLTDPYWCGMAGCTMVVFEGTTQGYQPLSSMTLIHAPVWVSPSQTNGWHDLIVEISGGGAEAKAVALKFDGSQYPSNPSLEPALEEAMDGSDSSYGEVLFSPIKPGPLPKGNSPQ